MGTGFDFRVGSSMDWRPLSHVVSLYVVRSVYNYADFAVDYE